MEETFKYILLDIEILQLLQIVCGAIREFENYA